MNTALVISPDRAFREGAEAWLRQRQWSVVTAEDGSSGLELSVKHSPKLVLCDLALPGRLGFQFCHDFRRRANPISESTLIAAGSNGDRFIALEAGADAYVTRPLNLDHLASVLARLGGTPATSAVDASVSSEPRLKFWGVRGSIPTPGSETSYYGGNTSCVEVRVGHEVIILDSGSGIRKLGQALAEEFKGRPVKISLLITHTHWDHIQGFPFFMPAYNPKNQVTIYGFEGARQGLQSTLSSQMESPYFPISMHQMPGHISIEEIKGLNFKVGEVPVRAEFLNHPGACTGYRLSTPGGDVCYLPDVELFQGYKPSLENDSALLHLSDRLFANEQDHKVLEFIKGAEVVMMDAHYNAAEYQSHVGWGHSCADYTVAFALKAGVKRLFLFHHDPDHGDEEISRMVARARQAVARRGSSLIVEAAREGVEVVLNSTAAK